MMILILNLSISHLSMAMFLGRYTSQLIWFARASSHVVDFNTCNKMLAQKLQKQGYGYRKLRKKNLNFISDTMI